MLELSDIKPSKTVCNKAIKFLEQYERLSGKKGVKLSKKRLEKLKELMKSGEIKCGNLPATLQSEFPVILKDYSLKVIRQMCGKTRAETQEE